MFALREGKWRGAAPLGHDPEGKTLGILGMGGIGRNLKKKAEAFGMKVTYYNRTKLSDELADGARYVSFDELLATSDVISLNLPLNVSWRNRDGKEKRRHHPPGRLASAGSRRRFADVYDSNTPGISSPAANLKR